MIIIILYKKSQQKNLKDNLLLQGKILKKITFPVPIEKEGKTIGKRGDEITNAISYRLKFLDSAIFMASSMSNLANNLTEKTHKIHKIKCNHGHDNKNGKTSAIKYRNGACSL